MSMPPGPPVVPFDDSEDDGLDPDSPDEVDDDDAAAEALGYADPEDAPLRTHDDPGSGDRPEDDSTDEPS